MQHSLVAYLCKTHSLSFLFPLSVDTIHFSVGNNLFFRNGKYFFVEWKISLFINVSTAVEQNIWFSYKNLHKIFVQINFLHEILLSSKHYLLKIKSDYHIVQAFRCRIGWNCCSPTEKVSSILSILPCFSWTFYWMQPLYFNLRKISKNSVKVLIYEFNSFTMFVPSAPGNLLHSKAVQDNSIELNSVGMKTNCFWVLLFFRRENEMFTLGMFLKKWVKLKVLIDQWTHRTYLGNTKIYKFQYEK